MKILTACLALALLAPPAFAQPADGDPADGSAEAANQSPPRSIHLSELLDVIVQENPELARTAVDVSIANATALQAEGIDDWQLSATGLWASMRHDVVAGNPFQITADDSLSMQGELSRALPTGGTVDLKLKGGWAATTYAIVLAPGSSMNADSTLYQGSLIASVTQPLLAGSGRKVARAQQRRARLARDVATLQREIAATTAVQQVISGYWELAFADRTLEIRKQSLDLAREQLRITRLAIGQKVAAPTEALAIEQAIAVREQAVLAAEIQRSEQSLTLRRLVGLEIGPGKIDLTAADLPKAVPAQLDLDKALARAREQNPRLALARLQEKTAAVDVDVAADAMRPHLDAAASIGPDASSNGVGDTLEQMGTLSSFSATASLTYRQSLGNRGARGADAAARGRVSQAKLDAATLQRDLSVEVVRAMNLLRAASKRIEVANVAIELAEKNLDNEKVLFQAGESRSFDVLARQDELAQAKLSMERARVDQQAALTGLEALTGDLLGRYGVSAELTAK